ncbi:hypothetical protein DRP43_02015 [candidate division TA06 bacterium]|uniref:Lanthionine synthetase C-like protein n=1 Tax=candidate division TA06 bacterium TaxID=2250710 RepID=A0A660SM86_UNCT6|nr:MAG: hypothetical protein DRP43_02015 [candidate division TA06 bacterium]
MHFWYKLKEQMYLENAYRFGDYLINNYPKINDRLFWNNKGGKIYLGYAHGSSGVALFLGLSSIGESFIDMYQFLGDNSYQEIATKIAKKVIMYSIKINKSIIYPGNQLIRLSCDYGTGSSGIGIFLNRLIKNKKRKFVNDYLLEDL